MANFKLRIRAQQDNRKTIEEKEICLLNQNSFVRFQIFLDGLDTVAGIGDTDGVGLAEFVMHEEFADHSHLKICFRHAPNLTGFEWFLDNAAR